MSSETSQASTSSYSLPSNKCLSQAAKLSIVEDKPIMMDYWVDSLEKKVIIGVKGENEKLLVRNEEEYTSPFENIYNGGPSEYLIVTQNSIYIVSSKIDARRVFN